MVSFDHAKRRIETPGAVTIALLTQMQIVPALAGLHDDLAGFAEKYALVVYNEKQGEVKNVRTFSEFAAADAAFCGEANGQGVSVPRKTVGRPPNAG